MRIPVFTLVLLLAGAGALVEAAGNGEGAIDGYDPVAYFTQGAAVPGNADFAYQWVDTTWHFVSAEHRDRFVTDPEKYAPAYGGYCAWAVAEGKVAGVDPEMWHIENGRLYLNFSARTNRRFLEDVSGNISRADANWPRIRAELEAGAPD
jgi:YHS domain-containing protein